MRTWPVWWSWLAHSYDFDFNGNKMFALASEWMAMTISMCDCFFSHNRTIMLLCQSNSMTITQYIATVLSWGSCSSLSSTRGSASALARFRLRYRTVHTIDTHSMQYMDFVNLAEQQIDYDYRLNFDRNPHDEANGSYLPSFNNNGACRNNLFVTLIIHTLCPNDVT